MLPCKICAADAVLVGTKRGKFKSELFQLFRCERCGFAFIGNPWLDYSDIYSEQYYRGKGADPLVDYVFELENPDRTIRQYEWQGIVNAVKSLVSLRAGTRWLDFGCGNGGLVRYARSKTECSIFGYEHGWIRERASSAGVPFLSDSEINQAEGSFDVVTAIEVLEHVPDPIEQLRKIRSLLRPGGLFFFTTGNAEPQRNKLLDWSYIVPELHVSFFEPRTMVEALKRSGFRPEFKGFYPPFEDIIRFKILKNFKIRTTSIWHGPLPWSVLARLADNRLGITRHPIGWAA